MVHIITDTTAALPETLAQQLGIPIIPQVINFGTESFLEGVDLDKATFMRRLRSERALPKTAAPPPELFVREFARLAPTGEPILCIHPSADVSGTVRSALTASQEFPAADIRVLDTRLLAAPLATLVQIASQMAAVGETVDAIEARLAGLIPRGRIYFVVATLEYLARGGRIGGAQALLGSVLQIKPILTLRDGRVEVLERERTHKRALARLQELVLTQIPTDGSGHLCVMHADAPEQAQTLAADLGRALDLPSVPILDVPSAIVVHSGPGVLGVSFFV